MNIPTFFLVFIMGWGEHSMEVQIFQYLMRESKIMVVVDFFCIYFFPGEEI